MLKLKRFAVHQLALVIMSVAYLILALISNKLGLFYLLIILAYININIYIRIKWFRLFMLLGGLVIFAITSYISAILFKLDNKVEVVGYIVSRIAALSIGSYLFITSLNFEELIIYLMQVNCLPITLGYAILGGINSLNNISSEFNKIKQVASMRYSGYKVFFKVLYPLLVSTIRHAMQVGITLEARGLNKNKTFLYQARSWHKFDTFITVANITCLVGVYCTALWWIYY